MALGWFDRWRFGVAAKRYAKRIGAALIHDHGASDFYTPAQIDHAARKLGFPRRYRPILQAWFLSEEDFLRRNPYCRFGTYRDLRGLLAKYASWTPASAAFEPIGVSAYISAGDSIR